MTIVQDVKNAGTEITDKAKDLAHEVSNQVHQYTEKAQTLLHDANNTSLAEVEKGITNYIGDNPVKCLLGAVAMGFVAGLLISRR